MSGSVRFRLTPQARLLHGHEPRFSLVGQEVGDAGGGGNSGAAGTGSSGTQGIIVVTYTTA